MPARLPDHVPSFVDSTPWRFAKTYAATWPHESVFPGLPIADANGC